MENLPVRFVFDRKKQAGETKKKDFDRWKSADLTRPKG